MSSVQTSFAQIGPREKYFIVTGAAVVGFEIPPGNSAAGGFDSLVSSTEFGTPTGSSLAAGTLLKDLGRSITVYDDTTLLKVATYQKVARVSGGPTSEGDATFGTGTDTYVLVWTTDETVTVGVARVG